MPANNSAFCIYLIVVGLRNNVSISSQWSMPGSVEFCNHVALATPYAVL